MMCCKTKCGHKSSARETPIDRLADHIGEPRGKARMFKRGCDISARSEGRRRLHRRPRGQVSKFSTGAAEERQENPVAPGPSSGANLSDFRATEIPFATCR